MFFSSGGPAETACKPPAPQTVRHLVQTIERAKREFEMPSQITTHILDTALGKPAEGVTISLQKSDGSEIASGKTNADGRISDLLGDGVALEPGVYKMVFQTGEYYKALNTKTFYPEVTVMFETFDKTHYHVPLLLNPFGYSTYRGS